MALYVPVQLGSTLSSIVNSLAQQHDAMRSLERGEEPPTLKPIGLLWNTTNEAVLVAAGVPAGVTEAIVRWNGVAWTFLLAIAGGGGTGGGVILASGAVPFAGDQSMAGHKLTNVGTAEDDGDALPYEQGLHLDPTGVFFDSGGMAIKNLPAPLAAGDPLRKGDVPTDAGQVWFGGNRHPTHTVVRAADIDLGWTPRRLDVRLFGRGHRVSGGSSDGGRIDGSLTFNRWDADSTGGFAGTPATQTLNLPDLDGVFPGGVNVRVTWLTGSPKGFKLEFLGGIGSNALNLRNPSNAAVDGAFQVFALNDPNGG